VRRNAVKREDKEGECVSDATVERRHGLGADWRGPTEIADFFSNPLVYVPGFALFVIFGIFGVLVFFGFPGVILSTSWIYPLLWRKAKHQEKADRDNETSGWEIRKQSDEVLREYEKYRP